MITVYKYKLGTTMTEPGSEIEVEMPKASRIVKVDMQGENIQAWAMVDTTSPLVKKKFYVFATGQEIPTEDKNSTWAYQDTFYYDIYVWHVFEKIGSVLREMKIDTKGTKQ